MHRSKYTFLIKNIFLCVNNITYIRTKIVDDFQFGSTKIIDKKVDTLKNIRRVSLIFSYQSRKSSFSTIQDALDKIL